MFKKENKNRLPASWQAICHKCNQPNHDNLTQVSCLPLLISEKLFLRLVSLSLFIFWRQRVLYSRTQFVAWGELAIIFCFRTFNCYVVYSQDGQSNICRSHNFYLLWWKANLKTLALETFYSGQFT